MRLNTAYTTHHTDADLLPTVKAPAEELKRHGDRKGWKFLSRLVGAQRRVPECKPGKYLVDESSDVREFVDPGIGGRMTTR